MLDENFHKNLKSKISAFIELKDRNMGHIVKELGLDFTICFRFLTLKNQDFSNVDLKGWDFEGADLRGSIFTGAKNIKLANFKNAKVDMQDLAKSDGWDVSFFEKIDEQRSEVLPFNLKTSWFKQYKKRQKQLSKIYPDVTQLEEVSSATLLSFSLNPSEKFRILEALPTLSKHQKDELLVVFTEEHEKFSELAKEHPDDMVTLAVANSADAKFATKLISNLYDQDDERLKDTTAKTLEFFQSSSLAKHRTIANQASYMASGDEKALDITNSLIDNNDLVDVVTVATSGFSYHRLWNDELFEFSLGYIKELRDHKNKEVRDLINILTRNFHETFEKSFFFNDPILKAVKLLKLYMRNTPEYDDKMRGLLQATGKYVEQFTLSLNEKNSFRELLSHLEAKSEFADYVSFNYFKLAINYIKGSQYAQARDIFEKLRQLVSCSHKKDSYVKKHSQLFDENLCELYLVCNQNYKSARLCKAVLAQELPPLERLTIEFIQALAKDNIDELANIKSALKYEKADETFGWSFKELKFVSNRYENETHDKIRELILDFERKIIKKKKNTQEKAEQDQKSSMIKDQSPRHKKVTPNVIKSN